MGLYSTRDAYDVADPPAFSIDQMVDQIGVLADRALFRGSMDFIDRAKDLSTRIDAQKLARPQLAVFHYHVSNIWGNAFKLLQKTQDQFPAWEQSEIEKQLIHNRLAVAALEADNGESPETVVCSIITNLANTLFQVGRFIEAQAHWDKVISLKTDFGMAIANRGLAMLHYAHLLPDPEHALHYLIQARINLQAALKKTQMEPHARLIFQSHLKTLKCVLPKHVNRQLLTAVEPDAAFQDDESDFSHWRLKNRLFLNPLNDLGCFEEGANDILFQFPFNKNPSIQPLLHSYYQTLTREFVFSNRLFFEAVKCISGIGRDPVVPDIPDASCKNCFHDLEKLKISFRMAYSLFDKIAFFLRKYFDFPVPEKRVNFRTVWYRSGKKSNGLHVSLMESHNWPLRGLFWLSKDLYDNRPDFRNGLESDVRELYAIRNHLEHKYLMLETDCYGSENPFGSRAISASDFSNRGLRVLKMVRAALIYLALSVYREENPDRPDTITY
ncbi:MAG: LA2681 family HEPN domain-containing protein [Desulfatirhabdiaceae bacterium]